MCTDAWSRQTNWVSYRLANANNFRIKKCFIKLCCFLDVRTVVFGTNGETYWGGTNGVLYYAGLGGAPRKIVATYGEQRIPAINSITLARTTAATAAAECVVSVAGESDSLLISNVGCQY